MDDGPLCCRGEEKEKEIGARSEADTMGTRECRKLLDVCVLCPQVFQIVSDGWTNASRKVAGRAKSTVISSDADDELSCAVLVVC